MTLVVGPQRYNIWQQKYGDIDAVRFTLGADEYKRPDEARASRITATNKLGAEYIVSSDRETILVIVNVDNVAWAILYPIGSDF